MLFIIAILTTIALSCFALLYLYAEGMGMPKDQGRSYRTLIWIGFGIAALFWAGWFFGW